MQARPICYNIPECTCATRWRGGGFMRHVSSSFIEFIKFHQDPGWTASYSSLTVQPTERGSQYVSSLARGGLDKLS
jgi:hypothetical protein